MKFEDKAILILLTGILAYAICYRNNVFSVRDKSEVLPAVSGIHHWEDTIRYKDLEFVADTCTGLTVRDRRGLIVSGDYSIKPEALHLKSGQVMGNDTVDLLFCKTAVHNEIPCFRILEDGTLKEVEI